MRLRGKAFILLLLFAFMENLCQGQDIMVWLYPGGPVWENGYTEVFPSKMIVGTIAEVGFTDICFSAHKGRGGAFFYPSRVKNVRLDRELKGRDWLEETLAEADKHNLRVWVAYTPAKGLRSPEKIDFYRAIIAELGEKYKPRHKSLCGIMLHEFNCAEAKDAHHGELKDFAGFCSRNFGEKYNGNQIPNDSKNDKWTRRFYLYKADTVTNIARTMAAVAAKYRLKTFFCLYDPEYYLNSARWGYDTVELEKYCDNFWVNNISGYSTLRGAWVETSASYKGINLPRKRARSFHGKPISFFEYRAMLFPEIVRRGYKKIADFTKVYGDYFTGYLGRSRQALKLFHGPGNVKKWNILYKKWIGAESVANIAILSASMPFILRHPVKAKTAYMKTLGDFRAELKKHFPVDTLLLDSRFALDLKNLKKYDLLIIPEDMGAAMSEKMLASLKKYLSAGNRILALNSKISTANRDLTAEKDYTAEIFGVKRYNNGAALPGYVKTSGAGSFAAKGKRWLAPGNIKLCGAKVLLKDKFTNTPLMTQKGNACYLNTGYFNTSADFFVNIVRNLALPPIELKPQNKEAFFTIPSAVTANNVLCIPLLSEHKCSAILKIDPERLGLHAEKFEVKDIVTGQKVAETDAAGLKAGVRVSIKFPSEPYVLAVGGKAELAGFKGIYRNAEVFAGMQKIAAIENPEVAIAVADVPGIKVGIYQNAYGADEIYKQLSKCKEFNCFYLPRLDAECMQHAEVIIIPQPRAKIYLDNAVGLIKSMVKHGKGLILTHDSALKAQTMFPNVIKGNNGKIEKIKDNKLKILPGHPVTATFKAGEQYVPGFAYDHYALLPGKNARILAQDMQGNNVIIAGNCEKGKVVVFGTLPGVFCLWNDCGRHLEKDLQGCEFRILADSIKWLKP